jgi:acetyltransferase-like isoleucine patch superfamily enzyme
MRYVQAHPRTDRDLLGNRPGRRPCVHPGAVVVRSHLGQWSEVGASGVLRACVVGDYCRLGRRVRAHACHIGKFSSIANGAWLGPCPEELGLSLAEREQDPRTREAIYAAAFARSGERVVIGQDVWIGRDAVVLPGVRIGTGAVVEAGAVVVGNVHAFEVVGGVPAAPLREHAGERMPAGSHGRISLWETAREAPHGPEPLLSHD